MTGERHTAFCRLCQPNEEMPAEDILNHLRLMHPGVMDGVATWPDGGLLIVDETVETVADILHHPQRGQP